MNIYEQIEEKRLELYTQYKKQNRVATIAILIMIAVVLLVLFVLQEAIENFVIVFVIIFMIGIGVFATFKAKADKIRNQYVVMVKDQFVNAILTENFENPIYQPKQHLAVNKINSAGLVRVPDRYHGEDYIGGSFRGVKFEVSDITLEQRHEVRTKNGRHVTYIPYFKGRWYVFKYPKNFLQTIKIVESNGYTNTRGLTKFDTEMVEFNKKFSIYSSDEHLFYYLMNPYMIERFLILENEHRGTIFYCFKNDELHIGVNDNSDSLRVDFSKAVNEATFKAFKEDITLIGKIINEFRLYDIKFKE